MLLLLAENTIPNTMHLWGNKLLGSSFVLSVLKVSAFSFPNSHRFLRTGMKRTMAEFNGKPITFVTGNKKK